MKKTVTFGCGHTAEADQRFLKKYGRKVCPGCIEKRVRDAFLGLNESPEFLKKQARKQKQKDILGNDHRAVEVPYWQFKLVEEFGIKQLPGSYNRYKQTTKIAFPRGVKQNSTTALLNYLFAKKNNGTNAVRKKQRSAKRSCHLLQRLCSPRTSIHY